MGRTFVVRHKILCSKMGHHEDARRYWLLRHAMPRGKRDAGSGDGSIIVSRGHITMRETGLFILNKISERPFQDLLTIAREYRHVLVSGQTE
jgi:hypothetical protein